MSPSISDQGHPEPDFCSPPQQSTLILRSSGPLQGWPGTWSPNLKPGAPPPLVKCFLEGDSFGTHVSCVTLEKLLNLSLLQGGGVRNRIGTQHVPWKVTERMR